MIEQSDYNFADQLEQNTTVYAPITFNEILIVVIVLKWKLVGTRIRSFALQETRRPDLHCFFLLSTSYRVNSDFHFMLNILVIL